IAAKGPCHAAMETRQLCPPGLIESIAAAQRGIEELSALAPGTLATAAEAAELLGALTSDADLANAVLAKAASTSPGRRGRTPAAPPNDSPPSRGAPPRTR